MKNCPVQCIFIEKTFDLFKFLLEEREIKYNFKLDPQCSTIWVDKLRVTQVLINLISNAMKYTLPGGEIQLSTSKKEQFAAVEVKDTGIGMSNDDLDKILSTKRYRTEAAKKMGTGGAGMGLTISKHIVKQHGGEFDILSHKGKGTSVKFTVPLHES